MIDFADNPVQDVLDRIQKVRTSHLLSRQITTFHHPLRDSISSSILISISSSILILLLRTRQLTGASRVVSDHKL
jgi:hypothetical protein